MNDGVRIKNFVKQSALTKAAAIFVLLLIFSVPLSMVRGILSERQRPAEAIDRHRIGEGAALGQVGLLDRDLDVARRKRGGMRGP